MLVKFAPVHLIFSRIFSLYFFSQGGLSKTLINLIFMMISAFQSILSIACCGVLEFACNIATWVGFCPIRNRPQRESWRKSTRFSSYRKQFNLILPKRRDTLGAASKTRKTRQEIRNDLFSCVGCPSVSLFEMQQVEAFQRHLHSGDCCLSYRTSEKYILLVDAFTCLTFGILRL